MNGKKEVLNYAKQKRKKTIQVLGEYERKVKSGENCSLNNGRSSSTPLDFFRAQAQMINCHQFSYRSTSHRHVRRAGSRGCRRRGRRRLLLLGRIAILLLLLVLLLVIVRVLGLLLLLVLVVACPFGSIDHHITIVLIAIRSWVRRSREIHRKSLGTVTHHRRRHISADATAKTTMSTIALAVTHRALSWTGGVVDAGINMVRVLMLLLMLLTVFAVFLLLDMSKCRESSCQGTRCGWTMGGRRRMHKGSFDHGLNHCILNVLHIRSVNR